MFLKILEPFIRHMSDTSSKIQEILDDQEVICKAHIDHDIQLILNTVDSFVIDPARISPWDIFDCFFDQQHVSRRQVLFIKLQFPPQTSHCIFQTTLHSISSPLYSG